MFIGSCLFLDFQVSLHYCKCQHMDITDSTGGLKFPVGKISLITRKSRNDTINTASSCYYLLHCPPSVLSHASGLRSNDRPPVVIPPLSVIPSHSGSSRDCSCWAGVKTRLFHRGAAAVHQVVIAQTRSRRVFWKLVPTTTHNNSYIVSLSSITDG